MMSGLYYNSNLALNVRVVNLMKQDTQGCSFIHDQADQFSLYDKYRWFRQFTGVKLSIHTVLIPNQVRLLYIDTSQ